MGWFCKVKFVVVCFIVALSVTSCVTTMQEKGTVVDTVAVEYPGAVKPSTATASFDSANCVLKNSVIEARWVLMGGKIRALNVTDVVAGSSVALPQELFRISFNGSSDISSLDMEVVGSPKVGSISVGSNKSKLAEYFSGKYVEAEMISKDGSLTALWRASLRDGANYVRTEVELVANERDLPLKEVVMLDAIMPGSKKASGSKGAVMSRKTVFFAYEHANAGSDNGSGLQKVGRWEADQIASGKTVVKFDVSDIVKEKNSYFPQFVASSGKVNIPTVKLLADDKVVAEDSHPGYTGDKNYWNIYKLDLKEYVPSASYSMEVCFVVEEGQSAGGSIDINRKSNRPLVHCGHRVDTVLKSGESYKGSMVMGVFPKNQFRRAFVHYSERERCNANIDGFWCEVGDFNSCTGENWLDVSEGIGSELVASWLKSNADVVMDSHRIGGDPAKSEVYGVAAWNGRLGAFALKNPSDKAQEFVIVLKDILEIPESSAGRQYRLVCPFFKRGMKKTDWPQSIVVSKPVSASKKLKLKLKPSEVMIFDVVTQK